MAQAVFNRYEKKFLLNEEQYQKLLIRIRPYVTEDRYGCYGIRNIYFDNETNELIRTSIEKPVYKEKFRIRCYDCPTKDSKIFLEIKKKYKGLVNKRRITLPYATAKRYLMGEYKESNSRQISDEIQYILRHYQLEPKMYLAYDRIAFQGKDDPSFRLTIDVNIRSRLENLTLEDDTRTKLLLTPGTYLMEVKVSNAMPLWFVRILSELEIRNVSFSKYGRFYQGYCSEGYYNYEVE